MIILDFRAVLHHSYHIGTDPEAITTALDNDINTAAYGFNQMMERYALPLLEHHAPIDILIAHDDGTDYRTQILPEYKKTKKRTEQDPEEKLEQKKLGDMMKRFWAAIGCTQAKVKGVEADDIIAYFCENLKDPIHIYTVDADLLQLQGDHAHVEVLLKLEHQEEETYKGIPFDLISLSKSMLGDSSDNYGGVKGFGPAKWDELAETYGDDVYYDLRECVEANDYDAIKETLEDTPCKALQLLYDNREQWRLMWRLAQLRPDLCWKPKKNKITRIDWFKQLPNSREVAKIFRNMGCADLLHHEHIEKWLPIQWTIEKAEFDSETFEDLEDEFKNSPVIGFDYETYPADDALKTKPDGGGYVDVKAARIAGASFTFGANLHQTIYLPVNHKGADNLREEVIGKVLRIAERVGTVVAHNTFFEIAVTKNNLDFWMQPTIDTQLMQSYVDEDAEQGLKSISLAQLGYRQASYAETVADPETGEERTMDQLTLDEVFQYGADDPFCTAHIWVLYNIILQLEGTREFFLQNETQSVHSLVDAYLKGAEVDWDALEAQRAQDAETVKVNTARLREILEQNCGKVSEKRAKGLIDAEADYIKKRARSETLKKLSAEGVDLESTEATEALKLAQKEAVTKFSSAALEASAYTPYSETYTAPEFKPTQTQLLAITTALKFDPPLENITQKAINEWLAAMTGMDVEAVHDSRPELTPEQKTFRDLLGPATKYMKKREGPEYDAFAAFCIKHNPTEGRVESTGDELSTGSPIQMQHVLYCKLGFPVRLRGWPQKGSARDKLGVEGSPQTDALAMQTALSEDTEEGDWRREAIECILAIKSAKTRDSLYHTPYPLWRYPSDGRIHPQIRNCGTVTRRPAGTSPNILQVSKHQEDGVMRSVFIPYEDEVEPEPARIVSIDFDQQELRIMASESGDETLIACYVGDNRKDVHSTTAAGIAKTSYENYLQAYNDPDDKNHEKYLKIRKRPAKQTNFLLAYMGESGTLSRKLIIPLADGSKMMDAAYDTYTRIQPWQSEVEKFARQHGYTQTAYGNRRHAQSVLFSKNKSERKRMVRQLVNAEIQGCAADILKIVLSECWASNLWRDTGATLLGPVYDEITSSVPTRTIVEYINRLVSIMTLTPPGHAVPMEASVSLGRNWRDQIELGAEPTEEAILEAVEQSA
jgi:DNA polymerase I-like protein with 3'-5' exonuclease and polymerase domains/5'-3' exonuclease